MGDSIHSRTSSDVWVHLTVNIMSESDKCSSKSKIRDINDFELKKLEITKFDCINNIV